jgi:hypothetical protein
MAATCDALVMVSAWQKGQEIIWNRLLNGVIVELRDQGYETANTLVIGECYGWAVMSGCVTSLPELL